MQKLLSALLFSLLSSQAYASVDYDFLLQPERTEKLSNQLWWAVSGNCTIETTEKQIGLDFKVDGVGSIDGKNLTSGKHTKIIVKNGDRFKLSANSGTSIEITKVKADNQSSNIATAIAHCHM